MKKLAAILVAFAVPAAALADTYGIDEYHTQTGFAVKHLVISTVKGEFGKTTGMVVIDDKDLSKSSVEATIDVTSINTRIADRDGHLKSPDFFDVAKFPTITFKSTKVEKAADGRLKVTGNLTVKGVTKPVTLDVAGPSPEIKGMKGEMRRGLSASTKINRQEFGLTWSKMVEAGPVVGDEVSINIDAELVKK
jgi:polyisoprenoid-binding protein YceI